MYESPIGVIYGEITTSIENEIYKAVQDVGILVNKEELLKALQYDRDQYDKGYLDGFGDGYGDGKSIANQWISVSERLPRQGQEVICQCRANIIKVLKLDADGDWYQDADHCYMSGFVIAWMPLPEPWKEEE